MGATSWCWIRFRLNRVVAGAVAHGQPRVAREPLGLGARALAQREHRPACVAHDLLVATGVAESGPRAGGRPALSPTHPRVSSSSASTNDAYGRPVTSCSAISQVRLLETHA